MKTDVITKSYDGTYMIHKDVIKQLLVNGTYIPNVKRVVFNLKTTDKVQMKNSDGTDKYVEAKNRDGKPILHKDGTPVMKAEYETIRLENPILVTRVWWDDNTTTTVRNSKADTVTTEQHKLSNGETVEVASDASKTAGLMAAVVKRTCGCPDENGEMVNTNMGKILSDIVESAHDQNIVEAETKIQKSQKAKRRSDEHDKAKKPAVKRYSYADLAQMLGPILEAVSKNPGKLNSFFEEPEKMELPDTEF